MRVIVWMFYLFTITSALISCKKFDNQEQSDLSKSILQKPVPQINILTFGNQILDEPKVDAQIKISLNEEELYNGKIGIEIRGKSSQMFPKKQYGFETRDANNEDLDVSLLEMPEEEDWILQAPYSDKSLIRNVLIYDLSREIERYASRVNFVELTLNDTINGVYVLMEKLKRDKNRININKLKSSEINGEDLTGGYIIKIDKSDNGFNLSNSFSSEHKPYDSSESNNVKFLYHTPDEEDITLEQKQYISDYIKDFENALASSSFRELEEGYSAYINTDSFIDFFLLNELANNVDGYRISTFIVKDKNKKLSMGPIWDFNLAFGNADYCSGGDTSVWAYKFNERCPGDTFPVPFWWERLLEDPSFVSKVKNRWRQLRVNAFSHNSITQKIDNYNEILELSGSIKRNFDRWSIIGTYVWPNNYIGGSYQQEINYIKNWINKRLTWLDSNIESL
tara:strand:- start:3725 stop:5080 length:1356 start_codon:yes stop_codon:yes gene_type:complete